MVYPVKGSGLLVFGVLLVLLAAFPLQAGVVTSELEAVLQGVAADEEIPVILSFYDRVDLGPYQRFKKERRRTGVVRALKANAEKTQQSLRAYLGSARGKNIKTLWIINGLAVTVPAAEVAGLAAWPEVASIKLDAVIRAPQVTASASEGVEDNLLAVAVPELWSLGFAGEGMVVASMDTGVDLNHPDLVGRWRGGGNSWFDPNGEHPDMPFDANGHGTAVMGVMVGGAAGGTAIGVAPAAQWIAVKIFDDLGSAALSSIHQGFQWLLDPDGNPDTDDAPDVVNNSWGFEDTSGSCIDGAHPDPALNADFHPDIQALRAAGIPVVFAAGNTGPDPATSISPANYPESFAVGAVNALSPAAILIEQSSARGPSACDATTYPEMVAPGFDILTSGLPQTGFEPYVLATGTSFSAPHVAGTMALLRQAFPEITVASLESTLARTADDLGPSGPDNSFGFGMLNALAAYRSVLANVPPGAPDLRLPGDGQTDLGTTVTFRWAPGLDPDGDPVTYRLLYADNPQFLNSSEITASLIVGQSVLLAGCGAGGLLLLGSGGPGRRRAAVLLTVVALAVAGLLAVSCGGGGGGSPAPAVEEVSATVAGLQPGTTYFWKVVADDGRGGTTESAARSFATR